MQELLKGDVAVVTGAGQGNGRAIAEGLARHGAVVAVTDVNEETAAEVAAVIEAAGGRARAWPLDVTDRAACGSVAAAVRSELGPASILVNNAGILYRDKILDAEFEDQWRRTLDVNLDGTKNMTMACLEDLRATGGRVVNIGSIRSFVAGAESAAYAASKGAILLMTKAFATELAPDGVRVNAIAPGIIATAMTEITRSSPQTLERFLTRVPMGRVGEPEDLVGPVVFLVSELSAYVTGAMLPVDGGYLAT
ncbi:MAG: glucose 1-dehydrogenase [Alphaproteobacteria bacterium]|jgi:NAD(P)-dependent dehydrogenase (short-subunit alcohol dehydrogenase family)|nr:glucose 1-dehydrogenase [Alphaproteobacteria bacterium]